MNSTHRLSYFRLMICLLQFCCSGLYAQSYLAQQVSVRNMGRIPVGTVLEKIAQNGNFNFAYNNRVIPADSMVSVAGYNGTLYNFLSQLLGEDYELKEVPGYIILRHALNRLSVVAYIEKDQSDQLMIKGHVSDVNTKKDLNQVSIYEKNLLISALTDEQGNFAVKIKNWSGSVVLTASKDNYRDTSLHLLQTVVINLKVKKKRYKYDPAEKDNRQKLERGFSRFFITSKQKIQDLNLGGLFAYSPYQVSLTPGLSSRGMYNSQVIDNLSLNLIGGYTAGVQGVELAGVFNIDRNDVSFLQAAGAFNITGGNLKGIQLAGVYNQVLNNANGIQMAGALNKTHNFSGGVQMAGLANMSDSSKGFQLAGLFNQSKTVAGSQIATLVNHANKVKGFQFGLINLADSSDYSIGLINLVKNGKKSLALGSDESFFTHLDFRSGGRIFYGLVGIAYKPGNGPVNKALDLGLGAHVLRSRKFAGDAEYVAQSGLGHMQNTYQVYAMKLLATYRINYHFKLFAGPALNLTSSNADDKLNNSGWVLHQQFNNNKLNVLSVGITYGVQYIW
ncbi:carboxypeptidase-like regulatory domain-containing protein [Mucilaginibacter sp. UR6-11]|uniref:carboxypeptidase-like regulatory domain-containing protein n=1 Tax=Mucilaginibacter sp. UR6-11 TaxID=1435644 RepID=UPI001E3D2725|nr:carboxypeptidase-like regulatory domain-containing protein [Mucilaginibacter sp. UR6-11]MCC8423477.1 carboxypeptidase-like regulatory domain-containing protein [Mucilaginibacter sp. UR6-11]